MASTQACVACGSDLVAGSGVCGSCGAQTSRPVGHGRHRGFAAVAGVVLSAVLLAALVIVLRRSDEPGDTSADAAARERPVAAAEDAEATTNTSPSSVSPPTEPLTGVHDEVVDLLISEAGVAGLGVDRECIDAVISELTVDDARAVLADDDDALSMEGATSLIGLFDCLDLSEFLDQESDPESTDRATAVEIRGDPLPMFVPGAQTDPAVGIRAPTLIADDTSGFRHELEPGRSSPVLLVFLAHWCPACNAELASLVRVSASGGFPDELTIVAVLTGESEDRPNYPASDWIERAGWPFLALSDTSPPGTGGSVWSAAEAFGLTAYPYSVLIDDGVVVDRWTGELGDRAVAERVAAHVRG